MTKDYQTAQLPNPDALAPALSMARARPTIGPLREESDPYLVPALPESAFIAKHRETSAMFKQPADRLLGHVDWDRSSATNERVVLRASEENRSRILRNQFVYIDDAGTGSNVFLGRIVAGPFFPGSSNGNGTRSTAGTVLAEIEIQGELVEGRPQETSNRPSPGAPVFR